MQVHLRALAATDVEAAVTYYRERSRPEDRTGLRQRALEAAITHLRRHPLTGSLRFAVELEIPDLRSWPLERFPYLIFYLPDDDLVDIWRVLHARRDLPAYLTPDPPH